VHHQGPRTLVVDLDGVDRGDIVSALVGAGIAVERVSPSRRLEDAFLDLVGGDSSGAAGS
jgi:ABC-2 type transport system ATP-binding protein